MRKNELKGLFILFVLVLSHCSEASLKVRKGVQHRVVSNLLHSFSKANEGKDLFGNELLFEKYSGHGADSLRGLVFSNSPNDNAEFEKHFDDFIDRTIAGKVSEKEHETWMDVLIQEKSPSSESQFQRENKRVAENMVRRGLEDMDAASMGPMDGNAQLLSSTQFFRKIEEISSTFKDEGEVERSLSTIDPHLFDEAYNSSLATADSELKSLSQRRQGMAGDQDTALQTEWEWGTGGLFGSGSQTRELATAFGRADSLLNNFDTIDASLSAMDVIWSIVFGLVNGLFVGAAETIRNSMNGPPDPLSRALISSLKSTVREVINLFRGIFSNTVRSPFTRVGWVRNQIPIILSNMQTSIYNLVRYLSSPSVAEIFKKIFFWIALMVIFTAILILFPGAGWILKIAAMIGTFLLSCRFLIRNTIPKLIRSYDKILSGRGTVADKKAAIEAVFEIVGTFIACFLVVDVKAINKIPGVGTKFAEVPLSSQLGYTFRPSFLGEMDTFKTVLTTAAGANGDHAVWTLITTANSGRSSVEAARSLISPN